MFGCDLQSLKDRPTLVEGEDFYREGAYVVFTAAYHLRRGYCCESGCRHCPYGDESEGASGTGKETELKNESSL
jgi:2-iminoacetate synthase ThiH